MMHKPTIATFVLLSHLSCGHPQAIEEVRIDRPQGQPQPALFFPAEDSSAPALLYLHSWSNDYQAKPTLKMAHEAKVRGFSFLAPNFQGPNDNPRAAGSCASLLDIVLARDWLVEKVKPSSIVLFGESGGGHAVLLAMAAWPTAFDAAAAWVPVVDLQAWHTFLGEHGEYAKFSRNIESIAGDVPVNSPGFSAALSKRSPLFQLTNLRSKLLIGLGARDGIEGSIPVDQGLSMYNALATTENRLLQLPAIDFSASPTGKLLVERTSGPVEVAVFDFAHKSNTPYSFEYYRRFLQSTAPRSTVETAQNRALPSWCAG